MYNERIGLKINSIIFLLCKQHQIQHFCNRPHLQTEDIGALNPDSQQIYIDKSIFFESIVTNYHIQAQYFANSDSLKSVPRSYRPRGKLREQHSFTSRRNLATGENV